MHRLLLVIAFTLCIGCGGNESSTSTQVDELEINADTSLVSWAVKDGARCVARIATDASIVFFLNPGGSLESSTLNLCNQCYQEIPDGLNSSTERSIWSFLNSQCDDSNTYRLRVN